MSSSSSSTISDSTLLNRVKERKSRRTHKNSRDGCPNCKTKRIKCTEELPSCHNCIKKNYKCGYLDFPKEKLDLIRNKNIRKQQSNTQAEPQAELDKQTEKQGKIYEAVPHNNMPEPLPSQQVHSKFETQNTSSENTLSSLPPEFGATGKMNHHPSNLFNNNAIIITPPTVNQSSSLQSSPLSDSPNNVNQLMLNCLPLSIPNENNNISPINLFEEVPQENFDYIFKLPTAKEDLQLAVFEDTYNKFIESHSYEFTFDAFASVLPTNKHHKTHPKTTQQHQWNSTQNENESFGTSKQGKDQTDADHETSSTNSFERSQSIFYEYFGINTLDFDQEKVKSPGTNQVTKLGIPLPNAKYVSTSFEVLKIADDLYKIFTNSVTLEMELEANDEVPLYMKSRWTKKDDDKLWAITHGKAMAFQYVYFSFFMDRSLNIILKACNSAINSESNDSCFDSKIQEKLIKMSYTSYGLLVKDLRSLIGKTDDDSAAIISWAASWTLFLHSQASIKTSCIFFSGSASLLLTCINNCQSLHEMSPIMSFVISVFRSHTMASVIPDYSFNIIQELYESLLQFKRFINFNKELTTKRNGYILRYFVDLENFLKELIETIYPKLLYINNHYKEHYRISDSSNNLLFIPPTIIYNLIFKWFKIVPSHALSVGKAMTPLKRTFYLYYIAIARSLANVFPSIRSLFLVDTWNLTSPILDFDCKLYSFTPSEISDQKQYAYLLNLSTQLMRIITFFNTRQEIISNYLCSHDILKANEKYLEQVVPNHDFDRVENRDIIHILPRKVDFKEIMITNFGVNTIINIYNYPLLNDFKNQVDTQRSKEFIKVIEKENHNQKKRIDIFRSKLMMHETNQNEVQEPIVAHVQSSNDFDYESGLFYFDYKVAPALKCLFNYLNKYKMNKRPTIQQLKDELINFEVSQKEIIKGVDSYN